MGDGELSFKYFSYLAKVDRPMRVAFIIVHHHSILTEFLIKILYLSMIDDRPDGSTHHTLPLLVIIPFVL